MTYKWTITNYVSAGPLTRVHSGYQTETKKDAIAIGREWATMQRGAIGAHWTEIRRRTPQGRPADSEPLQIWIYQDSFTGLLTWRRDLMPAYVRGETFTPADLVGLYHEVFRTDLNPYQPVPYRVLKPGYSQRVKLFCSVDLADTLETMRTDLPADLFALHVAGLLTHDAILHEAAGIVASLATQARENNAL